MKLGFTGTRQALTVEQFRALHRWLIEHPPAEFHHGCCVGADSEACEIVTGRTKVVAHPPTDRKHLSHTEHYFASERRPPLPYLERNRAIVDETDALLACPKGPEELRSGTWSTIRYARKLGRPITIIWPDGTVTDNVPGLAAPTPEGE